MAHYRWKDPKALPLFSVTLLALSLAASAALADTYTYTDNSGALVLTDDKHSIPAKYRTKVKVIAERRNTPPPKAVAPPADGVADTAAPAVPEKKAASPAAMEGFFNRFGRRFAWLPHLVVGCGIVMGFLLVRKAASLLPTPQLAKAICIAFFLGVLVFVYKVYVEYVSGSYLAVKEKTVNMMKKANQRDSADSTVPGTGMAPPSLPKEQLDLQ